MQLLDYYIECSILSTFLSLEETMDLCKHHNTLEYFDLDPKYFSTDFNKMICERINQQIADGKSLSLLDIKLDAWIREKKPQYTQAWFNIIGKTALPMSIAKEYYEDNKFREMKRLRDVKRR